MTDRLFDPKSTAPSRCTACGATVKSDCRHDREIAFDLIAPSARRPKRCLAQYDPAKAPIPF